MTPEDLAALVRACVAAAVEAGELAGAAPGEVVVERPKNPEHGDYATNVALRLAKPAGKPAREVAEIIAARLRDADGIAQVDVAGPGFLNVTLAADSLGAVARTIVEAGAAFGGSDLLAGRRINLEFVSANPTGPVTLASARWAAVGDALARVLEAVGAVGQPGVLLQRPRQPDRPVRPLAARPRARRADARGRLPGQLRRRHRRAGGRRRTRACSTCPPTRRRRCSAATASS